MNSESHIRYLLDDKESLNKYFRLHKTVGLEDVKRSALLRAREYRYAVPDHYYRLVNENSFSNINELSHLFIVGLPQLAEEYLEIVDGKVAVKGERMGEWQMLLTHIPPLVLVSALIWYRFGSISTDHLTEYVHDYILPSLRFTAIPPANLPEMAYFKDEKQGFVDLHVHLNGTIEADIVWQDFISHPNIIYEEIRYAFNNPKVKEQLAQMTGITSAEDFHRLFLIAGRLREWLFEYIFGRSQMPRELFENCSLENLLCKVSLMCDNWYSHPLENVFSEHTSPLILESTFYIIILDSLAANPTNDAVATVFHYYLLVLGLSNKLLVQQPDSFGFEQFQKYTLNNLRESSEQNYIRRFFQLAGNDANNVKHMEGRFSPKDTVEKNVEAINKIKDGHDRLVRFQKERGIAPTTLSLVAHFIKRAEKSEEGTDIRHRRLRADLQRKTYTLIALLNTRCSAVQLIKGVDAAASELDAPPEVFAPCFGRLRECGIQHITFHAGEEFFHILSGLRYIYETMLFLRMSAGDRIGHAAAAGVNAALWHKNVGDRILMRAETYLDDLLFSFCLITKHKDSPLARLLPQIALIALAYASDIYPTIRCSMHDLIEAWKLRGSDPRLIRDKDFSTCTVAEQLFVLYHSKEGQKQGSKVRKVNVNEIFTDDDFTLLQRMVLEEMHNRQVVIETLPTSNVMIGHHRDFSTYHLYNWYQWSKQGLKVPAIVVGTDDAGIFATNIYNEYSHIYSQFVFGKGLAPQEAMTFIRQLHHNAEVYKF